MSGVDASRLLVVLDADSTLIREEAIVLLADAVGSRAEVEKLTSAAMHGELQFAESLRARVATLEGLNIETFAEIRTKMTPTPGAEALIAAVHRAGGKVGVVSGGFYELLKPIAAMLGLDFCRANRLEVAEQKLTGNLIPPIIDDNAKAMALAEWADECAIPISRTVAIGDGANDIKMIARAGLGVAFCAKPVVCANADIVIDKPDLQQVIHLIGLPG